MTDNPRLLDELEQPAIEVADEFREWIAQGLEIEARYNGLMTESSRLVSATGKNPRQEGPYGHGLDAEFHALRVAVERRPVPPPLPDFRYTKYLAEQEAEAQRRKAA